MNKINMIVTLVIMGGVMNMASADDNGQKPARIEVRHSMLGYRDTLLFYTFPAQHAVMVVTIDNKDETFPTRGTVYVFDKKATEEALKKWINNQHSDGLYTDAPVPTSTHKLPKDFMTVTSSKQMGTSENPGPEKGTFKDFEIGFSIKAQVVKGMFRSPEFTDTARVHVKVK